MFTETEVHNCPGVRHEGIAEGQVEKVGEIECYTATPTGDFPKDKVLLFLANGFGINLTNSKLLVDDIARNGFRTVAPNILNGDPFQKTFSTAGVSSLSPTGLNCMDPNRRGAPLSARSLRH